MLLFGNTADLLQGSLADSPARGVDDPQQVHIVIRIGNYLQVGDYILDLFPLKEALPAGYPIGNVLGQQGVLQGGGKAVGAHQNTEVVVTVFFPHYQGFDHFGDELGFAHFIIRIVEFQCLASLDAGPQLFALAVFVMRDQFVGRIQDMAGRAVVLLQFDFYTLGKIPFELHYIQIVGTPPGIDGLVVIADHTDVSRLFGHQFHQTVLRQAGILELIHHNIAET